MFHITTDSPVFPQCIFLQLLLFDWKAKRMLTLASHYNTIVCLYGGLTLNGH